MDHQTAWISQWILNNRLVSLIASLLMAWVIALCRAAKWESLIAGALFALHPIHTDAVANVFGQAELIAAVIGMTAFLMSIDYSMHPYVEALPLYRMENKLFCLSSLPTYISVTSVLVVAFNKLAPLIECWLTNSSILSYLVCLSNMPNFTVLSTNSCKRIILWAVCAAF